MSSHNAPSGSEPLGDASQQANANVRKIPADSGYDAGDGYQFVEPQFIESNDSEAYNNPSTSDALYRRRSSANYMGDDRGYREGPPAYDHRYRDPEQVRHRSQDDLAYYRDYDQDSSEDDFEDERHRGTFSKLKRRLSNLGEAEQHDGVGNSQTKKWGATLAGAVIGATAARQAKKDHWVPAALGAFIGGMTAREAEKMYYRRRERDEGEREVWGGRRSRSKSRSRSRPRN